MTGFTDFRLVIVLIALLSIIMIIRESVSMSSDEHMTLKSGCDVRDTNCLLACAGLSGSSSCRRVDKSMFEKCFNECQENSPFC